MNLFQQFQTDPTVERNGVWLDYSVSEDQPGPRFLIARAGGANLDFQKAMEQRVKPIRRQLQNDLVDSTQIMAIEREVFASTVVKGWERVTDEAGNELPFSRENCIQLFKNLPDLFSDIREQANKSALYRKFVKEADAGNSQRS